MNLTKFTTSLYSRKELLFIPSPFDGRLELAALTDWVCKRGGPALQFKQVAGSEVELVTNLFGTESRMATALGHCQLADFGDCLKKFLKDAGTGDSASRLDFLSVEETNTDVLGGMLGRLNLDFLPKIRFWPEEQRSFFTLAVVITQDAETAAQNYGLYRIGIVGDRQLTLNVLPGSGGAAHLAQWQEQHQKMPVAILLGADPGLIFSAAASLPPRCDEAHFSAWLQGHPANFTDCQTVPLQCPASFQILIEGWVDTEKNINEGPFGCYTGRYGGGNDCPIIDVSAVFAVDKPLIPLTLAGPLPMEDSWLARANLELIRARLGIDFPTITSIAMPLEAAFYGLYFVKVNDAQISVSEVADQLRSFDYLKGLKMLVLLEPEEILAGTLWRQQLRKIPARRIWQNRAADLENLLALQAPQLRHAPGLAESLLRRLELAGIQRDELCGGKVII
ncbi:UbiD family decarboxylase [Geopsychrobacter electrodiphilus]|uniref:UbiD family decarboxylase n=1 Tax=Geopsychrobacter electrodiphilus TaxID=225196 RepID=UPI00036BE1E2|nr:UbiD family decarboxylase [Geopsychrobacter electrodiphilus]